MAQYIFWGKMFGEKINNKWGKNFVDKTSILLFTGKNLLVDSFFGLQNKLP